MKKFVAILCIVSVVLLSIPSVNVDAKISMNKAKSTLYVGQSLKLSITGTKSSVKWSTSNKKIATVTKGKVVAKKAGTVKITAKIGKKSYICKVTVKNPKKYAPRTYKVGKNLPAGEYALFPTSKRYMAYYEITDSPNGDIEDNDNFKGNSIITVEKGQYVKLSRCYAVKLSQASISTSGEGMFKIGTHLKAGEYELECTTDYMGYYCIYDSTGAEKEIIDNDNFEGSTYVEVENGDYLVLSRCKIVK